MGLHGALADDQLAGDLRVAEALGNKLRHVPLARSQEGARRSISWVTRAGFVATFEGVCNRLVWAQPSAVLQGPLEARHAERGSRSGQRLLQPAPLARRGGHARGLTQRVGRAGQVYAPAELRRRDRQRRRDFETARADRAVFDSARYLQRFRELLPGMAEVTPLDRLLARGRPALAR